MENIIGCPSLMSGSTTNQLTIFYNGSVTVFHIPSDKAEAVLNIARSCQTTSDLRPANPFGWSLLETLDGDLPIARRKSLQTFLQKRKERLTCEGPFNQSGTSLAKRPRSEPN